MKFTQTAAHNHSLLFKTKPKVRHVSFSEDPTEPSQPEVQQIQVKQLGRDNIDIHIDWSEFNNNMRKLLSYFESSSQKNKLPTPTSLLSTTGGRLSPSRLNRPTSITPRPPRSISPAQPNPRQEARSPSPSRRLQALNKRTPVV